MKRTMGVWASQSSKPRDWGCARMRTGPVSVSSSSRGRAWWVQAVSKTYSEARTAMSYWLCRIPTANNSNNSSLLLKISSWRLRICLVMKRTVGIAARAEMLHRVKLCNHHSLNSLTTPLKFWGHKVITPQLKIKSKPILSFQTSRQPIRST